MAQGQVVPAVPQAHQQALQQHLHVQRAVSARGEMGAWLHLRPPPLFPQLRVM
jgi:hypothetical protein